MSEEQDTALPARSRKPVDASAPPVRQPPAIGVDKLRDLQAAIEADPETDSSA